MQQEFSSIEPSIDEIEVLGAREHNLDNIDVIIPRNQLVVITGVSGSGKSSLAFDTIYSEGQRRYMESFSAYARQFLGSMEAPDVDKINGLSPVISIEQKTTNKNPRSTVGTVTEIYDFMRLLYARIGEAFSYNTGKKMIRFSEEQLLDHILETYANQKIVLLAPLVRGRKGHYKELFEQMRKQGYLKIRVDGAIEDIVPKMQLDRYKVHNIEAVIDRIKVDTTDKTRLTEAVKSAMHMGNGMLIVANHETKDEQIYSNLLMCSDTGISYEEPSPNSFSFNSPYGACVKCNGLGVIKEVNARAILPDTKKSINEGGLAPLGQYRDNYSFKYVRSIANAFKFSLSDPIDKLPEDALHILLYGSKGRKIDVSIGFSDQPKKVYNLDFEGIIPMIERSYKDTSSDSVRKWAEEYMETSSCHACNGDRLKKESLHFKVHGKNIAELSDMDLSELKDWIDNLEDNLSNKQVQIGKEVIKEIKERLGFLLDVGLEYLTLNRTSRTLSGGESQRIRLATQIGSKLQGVTYILDEPSIGLHQRDNQRLIRTLKELVEIGNSVLVVEHDKEIMQESDYLIDLGPGAGINGGKIVAEGKPHQFGKFTSSTAKYLDNRETLVIPEKRRAGNGKKIILKGARGNNLKSIDVTFPLGKLICVTGVSGSGKSTLINETLHPILQQHFYNSKKKPLAYQEIEGIEQVDKVIEIDQSPIGKTPRSNPATYIGVFSDIRSLFSEIPEAKIRGYKPGRFSFNVKGGRCETCQGAGIRVIEMNFLPNVHVTCEDCGGRRYNRETLEVRYKGKSISDVLSMSVEEATQFFEAIPSIYRKLSTLNNVGLGYINLGQQATTLSGGEAQRVKLAAELSKKDTGKTFYILDEPTTGLHFEDIRKLMDVINQLVEKGNSVLIIEHNMDVIKLADHIIDIGPEGGKGGGNVLGVGTPEEIIRLRNSHTAKFLAKELSL